MENDEELHPGHHSIRLLDCDYSAQGFYFVTVCSHEKRCIFGRIMSDQMQASRLGRIVTNCWTQVPAHFAQARIHAFVLMPNHLHGIVEIVRQAGAQHAAPLRASAVKPGVGRGSLGTIIRSFKAAVTKWAREELRWPGKVWQRNYFERVLRDGQESADAGAYIAENVRKWAWDHENSERVQVVGAQHAAPQLPRLPKTSSRR